MSSSPPLTPIHTVRSSTDCQPLWGRGRSTVVSRASKPKESRNEIEEGELSKGSINKNRTLVFASGLGPFRRIFFCEKKKKISLLGL